VPERGYVLVTLHRARLVDDIDLMAATLGALDELAKDIPVVFPVHPADSSPPRKQPLCAGRG